MTKNLYDSALYAQHLAAEKLYRQQIKMLFGQKAMPSRLNKEQKKVTTETLGAHWQADYIHQRQKRLEHKAQLTKPVRMALPPQKTSLNLPHIWRTLKYSVLSFGLLWAKPTHAPEITKNNYAQLTPTGALPLNLIMPGGQIQTTDVPLDAASCNGLNLLQAQLDIGYKLDSTQLKQPLIAEGDTLTVGAYLSERLKHQQLMAKLDDPIKVHAIKNIIQLPKTTEPDSAYTALLAQQKNWQAKAKAPYGAAQKAAMLKWHTKIENLPPKQRIIEQHKMQSEMTQLEAAQANYESKKYQENLALEKQKIAANFKLWQTQKVQKTNKTIQTDTTLATPQLFTKADSVVNINSVIPQITLAETTNKQNTTQLKIAIETLKSDSLNLSDNFEPTPKKHEFGILTYAGIKTPKQADLLIQPRLRLNLGQHWQARIDGVFRHAPTFTPVADSLQQFTANLQALKAEYTQVKQQGSHWLKTILSAGPQAHFLSNPAPTMALLDNNAACACTAGSEDLPHKNNLATENAENYWGAAQLNRRNNQSQTTLGVALGSNTPLQWRNKNQPVQPKAKPTWLAHASYQQHFDGFSTQARVAINNNGWGLWAQAQDAIGRWGVTFQQLNVQNIFNTNWTRKHITSLMLSTQTKKFDASLTFQTQKQEMLNNTQQQDKNLNLTTGWPLKNNITLITQSTWYKNAPMQQAIGLKYGF